MSGIELTLATSFKLRKEQDMAPIKETYRIEGSAALAYNRPTMTLIEGGFCDDLTSGCHAPHALQHGLHLPSEAALGNVDRHAPLSYNGPVVFDDAQIVGCVLAVLVVMGTVLGMWAFKTFF